MLYLYLNENSNVKTNIKECFTPLVQLQLDLSADFQSNLSRLSEEVDRLEESGEGWPHFIGVSLGAIYADLLTAEFGFGYKATLFNPFLRFEDLSLLNLLPPKILDSYSTLRDQKLTAASQVFISREDEYIDSRSTYDYFQSICETTLINAPHYLTDFHPYAQEIIDFSNSPVAWIDPDELYDRGL